MLQHRPVRLRTTLREGEELNLGGYRLRLREGRFEGDRSAVFAGLQNCRLTARTPRLNGDACRLDIFLDPNLIEIFVNDGAYVLSHIVYGLGTRLEGPVEAVSTI